MNEIRSRVRVQLVKLLRCMVSGLSLPTKTRKAFDLVFAEVAAQDRNFEKADNSVDLTKLRELVQGAWGENVEMGAHLTALDELQRAKTEDIVRVDGDQIFVSLSPKRMARLGHVLSAMGTGQSVACAYRVTANTYDVEFSLIDHDDKQAKKDAAPTEVLNNLARAALNLILTVRHDSLEKDDRVTALNCTYVIDAFDVVPFSYVFLQSADVLAYQLDNGPYQSTADGLRGIIAASRIFDPSLVPPTPKA